MFTTYTGSFAQKAASIISLLVLVIGVFPGGALAAIDIDTGYPSPQNASVQLGQNITFTVRADTSGSGNSNDWKSTEWDVTPDGLGAVCISQPNITQSTSNVSVSWTYTAVQAGSKTVQVKVFNQPNCNGSAQDTKTTTLTVTTPVVDVCPNVTGVQTTTPCADTTCVADGGTWSNNQCVMPTMVDICHKTGNGWNQISVNENGWNGHGNHDDDFLVDANNPCPPAPAPVDVCPNVTGMQTVTPCADTQCPTPTTWNIQSQTCVPPVVVDVCPLDAGDQTETPCPSDDVCPNDAGIQTDEEDCTPEVQEDIDLCPEDGLQSEEDLPCATVTPADTDGDGVIDESDNCPAVANADQQDADENGTGDVCETQEQTSEPEAPKKNRGHVDPVCNNNEDDDNDGLYDVNDPDCADANGSSESPAIGGTSEGDVLGACSAILDSYMGLSGIMADPAAVKILQAFLNKELGLTLEVNGEYDAATITAVKAFQTKYSSDVLSPWGIDESTGIVYKTTQRMINKIACPTLDLPMPELF
jgi:hypothetical protein